MIFRRKKASSTPVTPSAPRGRQHREVNPLSRRMQESDEPETVDLDLRRKPQSEAGSAGEAATRVLRDRRQPNRASLDNPVAGWLAVIGGPGKGCIANVSYGVNPIGRDASQKIVLDHGDERISRCEHALLTYDPANRNFHIQHGGGTNLTYLNGEALLTPTKLVAGDQIGVGETLLRFVPLCSELFDWDQG
jgi:hypothetical protein